VGETESVCGGIVPIAGGHALTSRFKSGREIPSQVIAQKAHANTPLAPRPCEKAVSVGWLAEFSVPDGNLSEFRKILHRWSGNPKIQLGSATSPSTNPSNQEVCPVKGSQAIHSFPGYRWMNTI
jgi:hypothetical protein